LDGDNKTEKNIGLLETLGEAIGDKEETSDWQEVLITSVLKAHAHGPLQSIHGQETLETRLNQN
jgi:hypothetical protein